MVTLVIDMLLRRPLVLFSLNGRDRAEGWEAAGVTVFFRERGQPQAGQVEINKKLTKHCIIDYLFANTFLNLQLWHII